MKLSTKTRGFTLVEMAVVLSVVGLLLGSALKSTTLIERAQAKRLQKDFDTVKTAVFLYQDQYKAIPGDDAHANSHVHAEINGNGDHRLDGVWTDAPGASSEAGNFWMHLESAGLLNGNAHQNISMTNLFGGAMGVQSGMTPPIAKLNGQLIMCSAGISGTLAVELDQRMDDGNTATGDMMAAIDVLGTNAAEPVSNILNTFDKTAQYTVCMRLN